MHHSFLGLHVADRKMVIWDDGKGKFSCTTLENTALALRNVLLKPTETADRLVRVSDFAVSQVELLEAIESCLTKSGRQRRSVLWLSLRTLRAAC